MRITILAFGSRGDVQPYVALGMGLQRAGHEVLVCAGEDFADLITARGLGFVSVGFSFHEFVNVHLMDAMESGRNTPRALILTMRASMQYVGQLFESLQAACANAEAIVTGLIGGILAYSLAEQRRLPLIYALTIPLPGRSRQVPSMILPFNAGPWGNALSHTLIEELLWSMLRVPVTNWRRRLGLPPLRAGRWPFDRLHGEPIPALYGHSAAVLPRPTDWPPSRQVTGYWFLEADAAWQPPEDLGAFLEAGPPPVYVGFGSMSSRDPEGITRAVVAALAKSGQRGVISTGWGGAAEIAADDVYFVRSVPHDWLFPRMAAVVHHGGVGTTAAGLRAGKPTVIVPFFGDQPFWGQRVVQLGVGPQPVPRGQLSADRLAYAIRVAATHEPIRRRAEALGECIRAEDGVGEAVRLINGYLEGDS